MNVIWQWHVAPLAQRRRGESTKTIGVETHNYETSHRATSSRCIRHVKGGLANRDKATVCHLEDLSLLVETTEDVVIIGMCHGTWIVDFMVIDRKQSGQWATFANELWWVGKIRTQEKHRWCWRCYRFGWFFVLCIQHTYGDHAASTCRREQCQPKYDT